MLWPTPEVRFFAQVFYFSPKIQPLFVTNVFLDSAAVPDVNGKLFLGHGLAYCPLREPLEPTLISSSGCHVFCADNLAAEVLRLLFLGSGGEDHQRLVVAVLRLFRHSRHHHSFLRDTTNFPELTISYLFKLPARRKTGGKNARREPKQKYSTASVAQHIHNRVDHDDLLNVQALSGWSL